MSKIAIIGIAGESVFLSVDNFGITGETVQATDYHNELGGKGFNQAVAAARYGVEVSFLCACYQGDVECFTEIAERNGIKSFFIGKGERSSYAVITTDKNGDNCVCVYRGAALNKKDVDLFASEIKTADILLINNEVPISVNERAVKIAKENGVKVVLNPAPTRKYNKKFFDKIDLFTPNEHETDGLDEYQNAILTLGEEGSLIKDTDLGVTNDSTTQSNTLLLTTGQSLRLSVEQVGDVQNAGSFFNAALDFFLGSLAQLQTECHVVKHGHVRIQSVVLEYHRDVSVLGSYVVNQLIADEQFAFRDFFQTGDHTQGGGLTTTGGTYQNQEFLVLDFQAEVGYGSNAAGVFLIDVFQG